MTRFAISVVSVAMLAGMFAGCAGPERKFKTGDMVRTKVGDYEGQVVRVGVGRHYQVRVGMRSARTDSRVLSQDGPIVAADLPLMWFEEYELEPLEKGDRCEPTQASDYGVRPL